MNVSGPQFFRPRLRSLIRKEFIQFFRDKMLVVLVLYTFIKIAVCGWNCFLPFLPSFFLRAWA